MQEMNCMWASGIVASKGMRLEIHYTRYFDLNWRIEAKAVYASSYSSFKSNQQFLGTTCYWTASLSLFSCSLGSVKQRIGRLWLVIWVLSKHYFGEA